MSDPGKFKDTTSIQIGPVSPYVSNSMHSKVALSLQITNNFIRELNIAKTQSGLDFISLLNTQIDAFQLISNENCRLETRFSALAYKVQNHLKGKFRSGRKREQFLSEKVSVSILENELQNVKSLVSQMNYIKTENIQFEKKCSDLFEELKAAKITNSELLLENNSIHISENSARSQNHKLENENNTLRSKLNSLSDNLAVLEHNVQHQNDTVAKINSDQISLVKENKNLRDKVLQLEVKNDLKKPRVKFDSSNNKSKLAKSFGEKARSALWFAEQYGLIPKVLTCISVEGENVRLDFDKMKFSRLDNADKVNIRCILYILDKFAISDSSYQELSLMSTDLPSLTALKIARKEINSNFTIFRCPGNMPGAYVSIANAIVQHIRSYNINPDENIKVKFAGDGAKISRISNFVTMSISFPGTSKCTSEIGVRTIAVVKCAENYDNLKVACGPVLNELNALIDRGNVAVDDHLYQVEFIFGGDMKFLQICLGLYGSTANYACPWCIVSKSERLDLSKEIDYYDSKNKKRTLNSLKQNAASHRYGSKHEPLIKIDPNNVVIDELHLQLRICDILISNLIDDCRQADSRLEVLGQSPHHLNDLVNKIRECGVSFSTFIDKSSSDLNWTSLTGNDYKKLLIKLPEKLCFVIQNDTLEDVLFIWREFGEILKLISKCSPRKTELFNRIQSWMIKFLSIEEKGRIGYGKITPYMHALLYHVPNMIERHGPLSNLSGQNVEKLNDVLKHVHQKSSNKQDQTVDELTTRKRIEHLADTDSVRKKRKYIKQNFEFWDKGIFDQRQSKKQKIKDEISKTHDEYMSRRSVSETVENRENCNLETMSVTELKRMVKSLGITTRLRSKSKLIELILNSQKA